MVRQTKKSGLVSKVYMERQAKSGKKLCLGIQDKEIETHIKQNPTIGFLQNLLQQTRLILVYLFVYGDIVM